MKTSYLFLADGFEETEALATVDILRRAGATVKTVSTNETTTVTGAHGIVVTADSLFDDNNYNEALWLILPGGLPGAPNLAAHSGLRMALLDHNRRNGKIAAICASPAMVLGPLGILSNRDAVCYPGCEQNVPGVRWGVRPVASDDNIVTGNGPAAAPAFALTIAADIVGNEKAREVADGMLLFNIGF